MNVFDRLALSPPFVLRQATPLMVALMFPSFSVWLGPVPPPSSPPQALPTRMATAASIADLRCTLSSLGVSTCIAYSRSKNRHGRRTADDGGRTPGDGRRGTDDGRRTTGDGRRGTDDC